MLDHLSPFRRRSVALALYRMLTGRRFDICVVRDALTVADLHPERAAFEAVRLHHGVPYAEMPPGFPAELAARTLALFAEALLAEADPLPDLARLAGVAPALDASVPALA
jgi:hypothetical protein